MQEIEDGVFGNPEINPKAFVFNPESVIGKVHIEHDVIIAPGASIRADECGPFYIGKGTNIQDGVILHGLLNKFVLVGEEQFSIWIGSHCSIAHRALVHGPTMIGKKTFIGFDAIIHASKIYRNCFIDFRATVKNSIIGPGCHIGIGAIVMDVAIPTNKYVRDGAIVRCIESVDRLPFVSKEIKAKDAEFNKEVVDLNKELIGRYRTREGNKHLS